MPLEKRVLIMIVILILLTIPYNIGIRNRSNLKINKFEQSLLPVRKIFVHGRPILVRQILDQQELNHNKKNSLLNETQTEVFADMEILNDNLQCFSPINFYNYNNNADKHQDFFAYPLEITANNAQVASTLNNNNQSTLRRNKRFGLPPLFVPPLPAPIPQYIYVPGPSPPAQVVYVPGPDPIPVPNTSPPFVSPPPLIQPQPQPEEFNPNHLLPEVPNPNPDPIPVPNTLPPFVAPSPLIQPQPQPEAFNPNHPLPEAPNPNYPLPECYTDASNFMCCNRGLERIVRDTFHEVMSSGNNLCNVHKISSAIQMKAESEFNTNFEVVTGISDFASKSHFYHNYICKVEEQGRFMLAYASPKPEAEEDVYAISDLPSPNYITSEPNYAGTPFSASQTNNVPETNIHPLSNSYRRRNHIYHWKK